MRKLILKTVALSLCIALLCLSFCACSDYSLDSYEEDTEQGRQSYYVAMSVWGHGVIILYLDGTRAPLTVANFVRLVREDFYDGLTFHRVIDGFMIQGGDPKADGTGGSSETIPGEFIFNGWYNDLSHTRGVISMARSSYYDSASSQFFICNADSTFLDYQYAAFGWVVEGMDVVDSITSATAAYGDDNGTIAKKSKQAVITEMKVIVYGK